MSVTGDNRGGTIILFWPLVRTGLCHGWPHGLVKIKAGISRLDLIELNRYEVDSCETVFLSGQGQSQGCALLFFRS